MHRIAVCWLAALFALTLHPFVKPAPAATCSGVEPAAREIIDRAIEAHGGESALRSVHSQRETGRTTIYLQGEVFRESAYLLLQKDPDKFYKESPIGLPPFHEKLIFASDGETSWTQNDGALAPYALPPEESFPTSKEAYPHFFTLCERGMRVSFQGSKDLEGERVHHLRYVFPDERVEDVFFEATGAKLREVSKTIQTSQGAALSRRRQLDYRSVAGIQRAYRRESIFPPDEHHVLIIESLEVNPELADDLFELPPPPELSSRHLGKLVGRYQAEGQVFTVRRADTGLTLELPGKAPEAMIAVTAERFLFHDGRGPGSAMGNVHFKLDMDPARLILRLRQEDVTAKRQDD